MAYAAVISLKRTIEERINPTNPQIAEAAYEQLNYLGNFLRINNAYKYRNINRRAIDTLDANARDAVWKLEDAVESHLLLRLDEERLEQHIDSFLKTVENLAEEYATAVENPSSLPQKEDEDDDVSPIDDSVGKKSTTVDLSNRYENIRSGLNWHDGIDHNQVVSLVGMAGIGKTHFARKIYQDPAIVDGFDITAWVSAGPRGSTVSVLVDLVAQIERKPKDLYVKKGFFTLKAHLILALTGRNYLIVLDDVWETRVYDRIIAEPFPKNDGSRIILTTRLEEVAKSLSTHIHYMRFLSNEESWNLLWRNVFDDEEECFPPHLEKVGRKIAENCEGLPLLILAVAKILGQSEQTEEYWKKVADRKTATFTNASDKISKVLSSSYEYLQQHLKACFLYLGVFPRSYEIPRSKLFNLWIAEDFFEPSQHGDLEVFSVECLEELVSSSVVIACKKSSDNGTKSCKLHSAYWHLCVKEARKSKFFHVLNKLTDCSGDYIESQRRLSVHSNVLFGIREAYESMASTITSSRSLLCTGEDHPYPVPICLNLMFLKVLEALAIRLYEFPKEVVKLLQLRYLALTHNGKLPSSISNLRHLQWLILRHHHNIKILSNPTCLPKEIWDMQELTHLRIMGSDLPDPSRRAKLPNLVTLCVNARSCTKAVFRSIPNLRKLGITIELQPEAAAETLSSCFKHIMMLGGLESLKCVVVNPCLRSRVVAPRDYLSNFPKSLRKVSLNGLGYSWKYVSAIGSLPNLKMLKLRRSAFRGAEWEIKSGKFGSLEFLLLEDIDVVEWKMHGDKCFPRLRRLIIRHCYKLKEIPSQIGSIRELETMEVVDCRSSVVAYAQQLRKSGNSSLKVVISSSWNLDA